jgi:hypothetical protein
MATKSVKIKKQPKGKVKLTAALKKKGVSKSHVAKVNKLGKTIVIKVNDKAKGGRSKADASRSALKPGKRLTAHGTVYTENRKNRSDKGKNL